MLCWAQPKMLFGVIHGVFLDALSRSNTTTEDNEYYFSPLCSFLFPPPILCLPPLQLFLTSSLSSVPLPFLHPCCHHFMLLSIPQSGSTDSVAECGVPCLILGSPGQRPQQDSSCSTCLERSALEGFELLVGG